MIRKIREFFLRVSGQALPAILAAAVRLESA